MKARMLIEAETSKSLLKAAAGRFSSEEAGKHRTKISDRHDNFIRIDWRYDHPLINALRYCDPEANNAAIGAALLREAFRHLRSRNFYWVDIALHNAFYSDQVGSWSVPVFSSCSLGTLVNGVNPQAIEYKSDQMATINLQKAGK